MVKRNRQNNAGRAEKMNALTLQLAACFANRFIRKSADAAHIPGS